MEKDKGLFSFRKHPVGDFLDEKEGRKRKGGRLRQSMGFLMAAALIFNTLPASGLAVSASGREAGLCEHHTEHTPDCGYREAQPCTHEHTEECYKTVTECVHTHTDGCYPETGETEESMGEGNATPSDAGNREPSLCTHVCSEESGCVTKVLDCHHEHDESCGYQEAQDCGYVCEICNGTEPEDTGENTEDTGTDTAKCICETLCTEDSINGDCPVCGADDASLLDCKGKAPEENTENQEDTGICKHHQEHDADCGYIPKSEDGEGSLCTYKCRICPVEDLIAALPDKVTEDNAEDVRAQLEEILVLYGELNEDEQEEIDLSRCYELQEALDNANAPVQTAEEINISQTLKNILTAEDGGCPGHTFTGTVQAAMISVESGTHNVTFSGLNIFEAAYVGIAPNATMNLTLEGSNTIKGSECGIYVPKGATLVITAESAGSLDVSGPYSAGIGGSLYDLNNNDGDIDCGTVIINGGNITATGGSAGYASAGIGGAAGDFTNDGKGGNITINGGKVVAKGGFDGISDAPGIGGSTEASSDGLLTLSSANVLDSNTILGSKGTYNIKSAPTADMISVPSDMHYTSADMAAEIKGKVTLAGNVTICNQDFTVDTSGWILSVTKVSDMEYTATYTHADKGTISKTVIILPCIHNNGAALTHHDRVEADCTHTGILEYWECSVCGKKFSDQDGQNEITDTEIPIAAHTLTHHEKVDADCTQTGTLEYWECSVCKKIFSDKDGQAEITDIIIPITDHTLIHHAEQGATCTAAGNKEYWDCSICGKKFSDQDGKTEIADADIVIAVKAHTLTHHEGREAGCLTDGNIEYWSCDVCNKLFSDSDGKQEITDTKISAKGHEYGAWESTGNGTHTHSCQRSGCDSTETENCTGGTATYTEKAKCTVCGGEYGELLKDAGAPTGEISIGTNKWNSFWNTITFGLFFKKTEQVTITAQDNESGVASVSYYISDSGLTEDEVKALDSWTAGNTDKTTFNISPDQSCVVYARITDNQGNVKYISSDGMVFDGTSPSITGVMDGETYCTSQTVTVTDDNLESVTVNGKEQALSDGKFTLDVKFDTTPIVIAATDKAGNVTTVTVNAGHNYGTDWKSDSNGHWHECAVCGEKSEVLAHTEDSGTVTKPATETETGIRTYKCSVCGYEMRTEIIEKLPESHKHSYGTEWKFDSNNHWHECDCGAKSDSAAHTEDSGTVTKPATETETGIRTYKCSVCGYEMRTEIIEKLPESHKHSYGTEWKFDSNNHWHECSCGEKSGTAAHTWDSGTVTVQPTTDKEGEKTFTCTVCGKTKTETLGKLPPSHKHSYGTEWKSDNSNHWHECSCGEKSGTAAHRWDSGTVTVQPTTDREGEKTYTCTVCGRTRTETLDKLPPSHTENSQPGDKKPDNNSNQPDNKNTGENQPGSSGSENTEDTKADVKIPFIKDQDGKNGWDVIRTEEEKAEEGSIINIDMNGSAVVPGDIFDSIKGKDITITFDMGNGIIWSVNGKNVTTDKADDIDFSVKTGTNAIPVDIVNNITGECYSIQLSLSHEGEFGFTAILSINLGKDNAGLTANLYYYNESTGELEFIFADTVAEDGMVSLAFTHASDYAVVIDADSMEQETGAGSTAEAPKTGEESTSADTTDADVNDDLWNRIWVFAFCGVLVIAGLVIFFVGRKKNSKG